MIFMVSSSGQFDSNTEIIHLDISWKYIHDTSFALNQEVQLCLQDKRLYEKQ